MEKLIELLNEYCGEGEWTIECDVPHNVWHGDYAYEDEVPIIISKQYGFIKWLVENDKIELCPISKDYRIQIDLFGDGATYGDLGGEYRILMLLSISDTPIEDLISYLK